MNVLLQDNPCQHPIIIIRDIKHEDLSSILHFMYNGEVNVAQESLNSFLKSAEFLKVRGLTDDEENNSNKNVEIQSPSESPHGKKRKVSSPSKKSKEDCSPKAKVYRTDQVKEEMIDISDETGEGHEADNVIIPPHPLANPHDFVDEGEEQYLGDGGHEPGMITYLIRYSVSIFIYILRPLYIIINNIRHQYCGRCCQSPVCLI